MGKQREFRTELGATMSARRIDRGMLMKDLADAINARIGTRYDTSTVSKWEHGKQKPSHAALLAWLDVLGLPVDSVLQDVMHDEQGRSWEPLQLPPPDEAWDEGDESEGDGGEPDGAAE
jgi:transcriptional regulator with XRE-family HTH domain